MNFDWIDIWRLALLVVCVGCIGLLAVRMKTNGRNWNPKTRDYWFALLMWCIAGVVLAVEGIIRDSIFSIRLVFVTAAALVTLNGLRRKGSWGDNGK